MVVLHLPDVMNLLLDAICVVDPSGRFISISGACESIFGYTPEEMIGKRMIDMVFHGDRQKTLQAVEKIMNGHSQHDFENRYVRKDGSLAHILWSARWSETAQVRVAVARDISTLRAADPSRRIPEDRSDGELCWHLSEAPPRLIPPGFPPIALSAQDFKVLLALATGGPCVSRQAIVSALGENFLDYDQRRLDTQMRRLRRKVEEACGLKLPITTLRGAGYQVYEEIRVCRHPPRQSQ